MKNFKGEDVSPFIKLVNDADQQKRKYNDEIHIRRYNGLFNCLQIAMYQGVANAWRYYEQIPSLV